MCQEEQEHLFLLIDASLSPYVLKRFYQPIKHPLYNVSHELPKFKKFFLLLILWNSSVQIKSLNSRKVEVLGYSRYPCAPAPPLPRERGEGVWFF